MTVLQLVADSFLQLSVDKDALLYYAAPTVVFVLVYFGLQPFRLRIVFVKMPRYGASFHL